MGPLQNHAGMIGVNNQSFTPFSRPLPSSSSFSLSLPESTAIVHATMSMQTCAKTGGFVFRQEAGHEGRVEACSLVEGRGMVQKGVV